MRVDADAARCRLSLGVNILVTVGTYHQRLQVVHASKADRDWTGVFPVIID
jgi:hypothetical protein